MLPLFRGASVASRSVAGRPASFQKRVYTVAAFRQDIADALAHMDEFRAAYRSGRVSRAFAERIMLAVTQVNGCRYCHYGHTRAALRAGVPPEDIRHLVEGELGRLPSEEVVALTFAQHYAETAGNPDPEAWQRLVDTYGPDTARDIVAFIRMITIGNLAGNTLDALLSRLQGRPAAGSSLGQELGVVLGAGVIVPVEMAKNMLPARWLSARG
jgi:AhpD family alkylhydroperoxidase